MIACEECNTWYHYKCMKIKESEVPNLRDWFCPKCSSKKTKHTATAKTIMDEESESSEVEEKTGYEHLTLEELVHGALDKERSLVSIDYERKLARRLTHQKQEYERVLKEKETTCIKLKKQYERASVTFHQLQEKNNYIKTQVQYDMTRKWQRENNRMNETLKKAVESINTHKIQAKEKDKKITQLTNKNRDNRKEIAYLRRENMVLQNAVKEQEEHTKQNEHLASLYKRQLAKEATLEKQAKEHTLQMNRRIRALEKQNKELEEKKDDGSIQKLTFYGGFRCETTKKTWWSFFYGSDEQLLSMVHSFVDNFRVEA
eukprot:UN32887